MWIQDSSEDLHSHASVQQRLVISTQKTFDSRLVSATYVTFPNLHSPKPKNVLNIVGSVFLTSINVCRCEPTTQTSIGTVSTPSNETTWFQIAKKKHRDGTQADGQHLLLLGPRSERVGSWGAQVADEAQGQYCPGNCTSLCINGCQSMAVISGSPACLAINFRDSS